MTTPSRCCDQAGIGGHDSTEHPLWRVTYALPAEPRVIGVVRAETGLAAIERINEDEVRLGRGPIIREATDVERVWEAA
ncbi:hypothetical protein ACQP2Y_21160 [Actinoplanes sp. CA-051413]|uniref:hypothetical protein n=1 Tax=Actinoplanes sp. CA-051413 TaxID=3239899 RepID=UPI003D952296